MIRRTSSPAVVLSAFITALSSTMASAQPPAKATTLPAEVKAGACTIIVSVAGGSADAAVQLELNKKTLPSKKVGGNTQVAVRLKAPVETGDVVRSRRIEGGTPGAWDDERVVKDSSEAPECQAETEPGSDERDSFEVSAYFGRAVDTFAPASVAGYANPGAGGKQWSYVGGFDFEFRATGSATSKRQLWLFGETLHGVRSADVDCKDTNSDKPPVCATLPAVDKQQALQFVIDHASSIEAYAGARYEFMTLQGDTDTPAKLYAVARLGVMMLDGATTLSLQTANAATAAGTPSAKTVDIQLNRGYRAYHFGGGLLLPKGDFRGSYLEVGYGRTDLFNTIGINPWRRLKVDGYLSIPFKRGQSDRWPRAFAQLYSDFDPSHVTADSLQTFYGVEFDVVGLFGK